MIVKTLDGIGRHEYERDIETGDELHVKCTRIMEECEIDPTKTNLKKLTEARVKFQAHIEFMKAKYNV